MSKDPFLDAHGYPRLRPSFVSFDHTIVPRSVPSLDGGTLRLDWYCGVCEVGVKFDWQNKSWSHRKVYL